MLKQIKQQLTHERSMKQDAFHQVDELLTQVNNLDMAKAKIAMATKATQSTPGLMPHGATNRTVTSYSFHAHPKTAPSNDGTGTSPRVIQRLKSNQPKLRTPSASEIVEMNRELDALKLI